MRVSLIAAVANNGVIGSQGAIPWRLPEDLRWFRAKTMGHHVVMGRRTWESLGRALPGRTNVVVTRAQGLELAGAVTVSSLAAALEYAGAAGEDEVFVIGGAQLYREALPLATRIYLTRVGLTPRGDTWFPPLDEAQWSCVERAGAGDGPPAYVFEILERRVEATAGENV